MAILLCVLMEILQMNLLVAHYKLDRLKFAREKSRFAHAQLKCKAIGAQKALNWIQVELSYGANSIVYNCFVDKGALIYKNVYKNAFNIMKYM